MPQPPAAAAWRRMGDARMRACSRTCVTPGAAIGFCCLLTAVYALTVHIPNWTHQVVGLGGDAPPVAIVHAPLSVLPVAFPKARFEQVRA